MKINTSILAGSFCVISLFSSQLRADESTSSELQTCSAKVLSYDLEDSGENATHIIFHIQTNVSSSTGSFSFVYVYTDANNDHHEIDDNSQQWGAGDGGPSFTLPGDIGVGKQNIVSLDVEEASLKCETAIN